MRRAAVIVAAMLAPASAAAQFSDGDGLGGPPSTVGVATTFNANVTLCATCQLSYSGAALAVSLTATTAETVVAKILGPAASSGTQEQSSGKLQFVAHYWNGSASTAATWGIYASADDAASAYTTLDFHRPDGSSGMSISRYGILLTQEASLATCAETLQGTIAHLPYSDTVRDTRICICAVDDTDNSYAWRNVFGGAIGTTTVCPASTTPLRGTCSMDPPSVSSTPGTQTCSVTGLTTAYTCTVMGPGAMHDDLAIAGADAGAGAITVTFRTYSGGSVDDSARTYAYQCTTGE